MKPPASKITNIIKPAGSTDPEFITQMLAKVKNIPTTSKPTLKLTKRQQNHPTADLNNLIHIIKDHPAKPAPKPRQSVQHKQQIKKQQKLKEEELQNFLNDFKHHKQSIDEEHFKMLNAYEWSKNLASRAPRSIESGNFFNIIDETLTPLNLNYKGIFKPVKSDPKLISSHELFPQLQEFQTMNDNTVHEYLTLIKSQEFISIDNPLMNRGKSDLFTIFKSSENPEVYFKKIDSLKKHGWKLIGSIDQENNPEKILVFERFIDKVKEQKLKALREKKTRDLILLLKSTTITLSVTSIALYLFSS